MLELCASASLSPTVEISPADLFIFAYRHQETEWNHTASLLTKIHNIVAKHPLDTEQLHPMKPASRPKKSTGLTIDEFIDQLESMER